MGDEGAEITRARIGDPHRREAIMFEEVEEVPSVASIGLCLAHHHGSDLGRFADEYRVAEPVHESVKPLSVAGRLDANRHGCWQRSIEALDGVAVVGELLLKDFASGRVEDGDLLLSRVQITSDECHDRGLLFGRAGALGWAEATSTAGPFS